MKQQSISKQSVQHGRSRTRNQRKRERIQTACMAAVLMILWMILCTVMVKAWLGHPAEQAVDGGTYMESICVIGGDSDAR